MRRRPKATLLAVVAGIATALLLSAWFAPVEIRGPSMRPWLENGDWALVVPVGEDEIKRGDVLVFREPDSGMSAVKRVLGLPGEEIMLVGGDLLVDGNLFARRLPGPDGMIPLIHLAGPLLDEGFGLLEAGFEPQAAGWLARKRSTAFLRTPPSEGMLLRGGREPGGRPAEDLGIEVDLELLSPEAYGFVALREGGTTFLLRLAKGGRELRLQSLRRGEVLELGMVEDLPPLPRRRMFLTLANQVLQVSLDGKPIFRPTPYAEVEPIVLADVPSSVRWEQAGFGGQDGALIRQARVLRDFRWEASGTHACGKGLRLTEGQFFLLGDNSNLSRDSRQYGPVQSTAIRGRVAFRLWPAGDLPPGWGEPEGVG